MNFSTAPWFQTALNPGGPNFQSYPRGRIQRIFLSLFEKNTRVDFDAILYLADEIAVPFTLSSDDERVSHIVAHTPENASVEKGIEKTVKERFYHYTAYKPVRVVEFIKDNLACGILIKDEINKEIAWRIGF